MGELPSTVPELVDRAGIVYADGVALGDDDRDISFAQLAIEVDRAAAGMVASGLPSGARVAIWAPNSVEWAITALAVYAAGGVLVPLNTRFKAAEVKHVLERSRAELVMVGPRFLGIDFLELLESARPLPHVREVVVLGDCPRSASVTAWADLFTRADAASTAEVARRKAALRAGDICDVIFTSGTTGVPKGVMLRHGASVRAYNSWTSEIGLRTGDRFLVAFPYFQTSGLKAGIVACLLRGVANIPQPVLDVSEVIRRVALHKITVLPGPPTAFRMLLDAAAEGSADLSTLRIAVTGGATTPAALVEEMQRALCDNVVTAYGLTETTGLVSMCRAGDSPELIATSVGRAVPGVTVRAVDDRGKEVDPGQPGELVVRGYNVMAGYLDDPEATEAAIDDDGWLHTGDIGTIEAGIIRITDRLKDMFIVGGFNVYPAEVEAALLRHPAVAQVSVVGVPEARLGEVGAAFIVLADDDAQVGVDDIHTWCRNEFANYKVPRIVRFVDELPLNASGKVLKYRLRELATRA